jgi:hypothetical protein
VNTLISGTEYGGMAAEAKTVPAQQTHTISPINKPFRSCFTLYSFFLSFQASGIP